MWKRFQFYLLNVKPTGFLNRLDIEYEEESKIAPRLLA